MYNWSFLFVVLHKPTLLPSTFKIPGWGSKGPVCKVLYSKETIGIMIAKWYTLGLI